MNSNLKKRILFIINPISGSRNKRFIEKFIRKYINQDVFFFEIIFTQYAKHATIIAKEAAEKEYDAVIAIGGDGTINEIALGLVGSNTALGIIPNGSGNGLAHYLKIPLNIQKAVEIINNFNIIPIDTATINDNLFVSIAGLGFDALVANDFAKVRKRGFFSYFKIIIKNYFTYHRKTYIIYINNLKIIRKAMMITLANSNQFGYNTVIAPNAVINDGLLEICLINKVPILEAPMLSLLLFLRKIDVSKRIEIFRANELRILHNKNKTVHIDGDPKYLDRELRIKVNPHSQRVIVPEKTFFQLSSNLPTD